MNIKFDKKDPTRAVFVRFTQEQHAEFERIAFAEHATLSTVIRTLALAALEEYLAGVVGSRNPTHTKLPQSGSKGDTK